MWHWANWGNGFCNGNPFFGPGRGMFGFMLSIVIWGLVLYGIIWVFRKLFNKNITNESDNALDTLRTRYASGDISQKEFLDMKATLSSK